MNNWTENDELEFEAFLDLLRSLPKPAGYILNPKRILEIHKCYVILKEIIQKERLDAELRCGLSENPFMGYIEITGDEFIATDPLAFADVILTASNFEVYPLIDGRIRANFTFYETAFPIH